MVEMNILKAISIVLGSAWEMLTSVTYPGTDMPIATIMIGGFVAVFTIRIVGYVLSLHGSDE